VLKTGSKISMSVMPKGANTGGTVRKTLQCAGHTSAVEHISDHETGPVDPYLLFGFLTKF
jgi:hypothetical protein